MTDQPKSKRTAKAAPAKQRTAQEPTEQSEPPASWTPTAEAKAKATRFRWIAAVLWAVAIAVEAVAIFWLLRQRDVSGSDAGPVRNPDTGILEPANAASAAFPQWAFVSLIIAFVVIGALSITGSILWKKANRLDPARKADTVRFFVQNQLGAIIAIIAFLPLIILVFTNKNMDGKQKALAGGIGVIIALVATFAFGADYNPPSVEKYTADQTTVIQLLGKDQVVWVDGGKVYHVCDQVPDIQTGSDKRTGTTAEAVEAGKQRLTLKFVSEMKTCGLNVPENADEITAALKEIQGGSTTTVLPAPVWATGEAPIEIPDAQPAS